MAIGSAVKRGAFICVFDEKGRQLTVLQGDSPQGYTGATVSVRRGGFILTFDEKGRQLSAVPAR